MIAVDTNVLVYAHRRDSEFFAICTHPRIYDPPSTRNQAIAQIDAWLASPTLSVLSESAGYWEQLTKILRSGSVTGPMVHDTRVAALCATHGARELWPADRDFTRFRSLVTVRNPLVS
jgi:predicted nucleic acid-binding protein